VTNWQVSRSSSVPPTTRNALYQSLPPTIKSSLRSKLRSSGVKEEVRKPEPMIYIYFLKKKLSGSQHHTMTLLLLDIDLVLMLPLAAFV
jgi:hypothetical protein